MLQLSFDNVSRDEHAWAGRQMVTQTYKEEKKIEIKTHAAFASANTLLSSNHVVDHPQLRLDMHEYS